MGQGAGRAGPRPAHPALRRLLPGQGPQRRRVSGPARSRRPGAGESSCQMACEGSTPSSAASRSRQRENWRSASDRFPSARWGLDQRGMRGLAQRLEPDGGQRGLDRLRIAALPRLSASYHGSPSRWRYQHSGPEGIPSRPNHPTHKQQKITFLVSHVTFTLMHSTPWPNVPVTKRRRGGDVRVRESLNGARAGALLPTMLAAAYPVSLAGRHRSASRSAFRRHGVLGGLLPSRRCSSGVIQPACLGPGELAGHG